MLETKGPGSKELALLGKVITEWDEVEFWLKVIFRKLAGIGFAESLAIFSNIRSIRTITDTLKELAGHKMEVADSKKLNVLLERVTKNAARRNGIVHATWYESDSGQWCRYVVPSTIDKISSVLSKSPLNQKIRVRHLFSQKDLDNFCTDASSLKNDIVRFWDDWDCRQNDK